MQVTAGIWGISGNLGESGKDTVFINREQDREILSQTWTWKEMYNKTLHDMTNVFACD